MFLSVARFLLLCGLMTYLPRFESSNLISKITESRNSSSLFKSLKLGTRAEFPISIIPILFPGLEESDPTLFKDKSFRFTSSIIRGTHAYSNSKAYGHSELSETLWLTATENSLKAKYEVVVPSFSLEGDFESDLDILSGSTFFSGQGYYLNSFKNSTLTIEAEVTPTEIPSIIVSDLVIGFRFRKLEMEAEESYVNCLVPNWDEFGFDFTLMVETYFPYLSFRIFSPIIQRVLNNVLADCDLEEMIFEGDLSCLEPETLISKIHFALEENINEILQTMPQSEGPWVNPCTFQIAAITAPPAAQPIKTTEPPGEGDAAAALISNVISLVFPLFSVLIFSVNAI